MMRFIYCLLAYLLFPLVFLHSLWRGFGDRSYWDRPGQRFGFGPTSQRESIWVHAVSVGEVQASIPLVRALRARHPELTILVTTVTPTGAARVRAAFGDDVEHRYAPYDLPGAVRRFFDRARPRLAVVLETELWPNLYAECGRRSVPLVLASARVSPRSVGRYRRLVSLFREALSHGIVIAAQSAADAERFISIGANPVRTHVTGNIKFDFVLAPDAATRGAAWRTEHAPGRRVWVAGSTHEGEEEAVLDAHEAIRRQCPDALLILVPRHPGRFADVATLLVRRGVAHVTRSSGRPLTAATSVLLGDTMGELMLFYAASDVAFVAGSLVPIGGHNLLEPASLGLPLVAGPHNFNGEDIARLFVDAGALSIVPDTAALAARVTELLDAPAERTRIGALGQAVVESNRGALGRLLALIEPLLQRGLT